MNESYSAIMRKLFKGLTAIILALALTFSLCAVAFADSGNSNNIGEFLGENTGDSNSEDPNSGEGGEIIVPEPEYLDDTVAYLYICSNNSGFPSLGHIWIYIENLSDEVLTVGNYELPVGEGVSVGCFALTRSDGAGIYYNVESYCGNIFKMDNPLYLKKEINKDELAAISRKILSNNYWIPMFLNCIFFAAGAWNAGGGTHILTMTTFPAIARLQIRLNGGKTDLKMFNPGRERVYKMRGFGSSAYLEIVSDGTVDTVPG